MSRRNREVTCRAQGFSFLEGARWHGEHLYISDFYTHRVLALDEANTMRTVCRIPGQPSGLGFLPDGALLVVSMKDRRLIRVDDESLREVADLSAHTRFWCNDMLVDHAGRAYVGNFGWDAASEHAIRTTSLALVQPDGSVSVAADELVFPNGVVLTPDRKTLLVAETFAARISAFDVAIDGSLSGRRTWASFSSRLFETDHEALTAGVPLPDGMALDEAGALWIGDASGRGPIRVAEGGRILDRIDCDDLSVFAVALGGPDRRTLYMCASPPLLAEVDPVVVHESCLLSCRVDVPGTGLP
jgi:sugar lactone lactonase YvrE